MVLEEWLWQLSCSCLYVRARVCTHTHELYSSSWIQWKPGTSVQDQGYQVIEQAWGSMWNGAGCILLNTFRCGTFWRLWKLIQLLQSKGDQNSYWSCQPKARSPFTQWPSTVFCGWKARQWYNFKNINTLLSKNLMVQKKIKKNSNGSKMFSRTFVLLSIWFL